MTNDHTALLEVLARIQELHASGEITPGLDAEIRTWLGQVALVIDRG